MGLVLALASTACRTSSVDATHDAEAAQAVASVAAPIASVIVPPSPADLLEAHRSKMSDAASAGNYSEVCRGTPWMNQTLCQWVAAKAEGKPVGHPDGEVFRAFFTKEHMKRVYGTVLGDAGGEGGYEVTAGGYRRHCILDTIDTKFSSNGRFNMWVQEQPEPREVTVNGGDVQEWVVLEESALAKELWDLAHVGGGVEATATAKDTMGDIAKFVPYSEMKGVLPSLPGATSQVPPSNVTAVAAVVPAAAAKPGSAIDPEAKRRARAECLRKCIAACSDDANCERGCATSKCPPG